VRVLVSAYACEPGKGSEPEAGWLWSLAAAREHEVVVLTRANNRAAIEAGLAGRDGRKPTYVYLDLPGWARFWKRGRLGIRLYYLVWQVLAARAARRLEREKRFDVVHHVTFANIWLPALACLAGPPFVLGPVGGGQAVPRALYRAIGVRGVALELLLLAVRRLSGLSPLTRTGWRRAAVILVNNEETRDALPRRHRVKAILRPHACVGDELARVERPPETATSHGALYAGRLHRFKGVALAIAAIEQLPDWTLVVAGDGPDAGRLRRLAGQSGAGARISFVGRLPRDELWRRLVSSRAFVFPSMKEGSPFAVAEAEALGVPVVALGVSGAAALARRPQSRIELVEPRSPTETAADFARALARVATPAPPRRATDLGLDGVARDIGSAYRLACDGASR
jgi:glycosyltransferase involved in cell wall biosynthesis